MLVCVLRSWSNLHSLNSKKDFYAQIVWKYYTGIHLNFKCLMCLAVWWACTCWTNACSVHGVGDDKFITRINTSFYIINSRAIHHTRHACIMYHTLIHSHIHFLRQLCFAPFCLCECVCISMQNIAYFALSATRPIILYPQMHQRTSATKQNGKKITYLSNLCLAI